MRNRLYGISFLVITSLILSASVFTSAAQDENASFAAARDKALEIVNGEAIGGSVSLLGVLGGAEQEIFLGIFAPFEEATGITIEYEGTRDLGPVLQTRVDAGNPPDIVSSPYVGQMIDFARQGAMIDLGTFLDEDAVFESYDAVLLESVGADGRLFNIFTAVNLGGLIWYDPNTYTGPNPPESWDALMEWSRETAASGTTPWCIGLESGAASGWPAQYWINELFMRQVDSETYNAWWRGELPWTAPEMRAAFEMFGAVATDSTLVYGGPTAVLATNFANGGDGLYFDPPTCYLHLQASFFGAFLQGNFPDKQPITDIDFFRFPDINPEYAGSIEVSGEVMGMFNDTPQARALIEYFASTEAQTLLAETGSFMSANKQVPMEAYSSPFTQRAAQIISEAEVTYYNAGGLMAQPVADAYLAAILRYVQNPSDLDAILADVDAVRVAAYSE
jgi:alpha-glucoside transport system substrate-binding protein